MGIDAVGRTNGGKRTQILDAATVQFGRDGYEDTKWADIAAAVGIGSTALYHYFESKQHCLFVIMEEALERNHARFAEITTNDGDFGTTLTELLYDAYDLTEQQVLCNRLLVAEQGLLANQRSSPREEDARQSARARTRDLEFAWSTFIVRGIEQGALPGHDPRMLANAVLGMYNSVWHWYRPGGSRSLEDVADFYVSRTLALFGLPQ